MGGRGSSMKGSQGVGGGAGTPAAAAQVMPAIRAAPAPQAGPPTGANGFAHLPPQQVAALEKAAQQQMIRDPKLAAGVADYIDPTQQANGKALSQNANWAMATGYRKLTRREQAMVDAVDKLAKPIRLETTLYPPAHDDFLQRLQISNYSRMNDTQLRKALVGKTWTNDCLESTAYDSRDNPFWPQPGGNRRAGKNGQGGSVSGNREVLIRYHTAKSTRAAFLQPSQSEAVLAVGTHHKITGVRSTRTGPSYTYGSGKKVIELEIEVW